MADDDWLSDTRESYSAVAGSYADVVRGYPDGVPFHRVAFELFAELVTADGPGSVVDVGCGPGHVTAYLRGLGLDASGVDLAPGMIELASRENPGVRYEVGSMTALDLSDGQLAGLLSWYTLMHIPDDEIGTVFGEFRRVLRPGGVLLIGFHAGNSSSFRTEGYGGHPMRLHTHRRKTETYAGWLEDAGFVVEARTTMGKNGKEGKESGMIFARTAAETNAGPEAGIEPETSAVTEARKDS